MSVSCVQNYTLAVLKFRDKLQKSVLKMYIFFSVCIFPGVSALNFYYCFWSESSLPWATEATRKADAQVAEISGARG